MNQALRTLSILALALTFAAAPAFAQQEVGDPGASTVQPGNDATTIQNGSTNEATIRQVFNSTGAVSGYGNQAIIDQDGNSNKVERLDQAGSGNLYSVTQDGTNNLVHEMPAQGSPSGLSVDGRIGITQLGTENEIWDADQVGEGNDARVRQDGTSNFADIEAQVSTGSAGNFVSVRQTGSDNKVGTGTGTGTYQEGNNNSMVLDQDGGATAGIPGQQTPSGNLDSEFQNEGGQGLVQFGDDNTLSILQGSGAVVEFVLQDGSMNTAIVDQGIGANVASVMQTGNGNMADITQN